MARSSRVHALSAPITGLFEGVALCWGSPFHSGVWGGCNVGALLASMRVMPGDEEYHSADLTSAHPPTEWGTQEGTLGRARPSNLLLGDPCVRLNEKCPHHIRLGVHSGPPSTHPRLCACSILDPEGNGSIPLARLKKDYLMGTKQAAAAQRRYPSPSDCAHSLSRAAAASFH